jgi:methionyl-tRNA formyltransferase
LRVAFAGTPPFAARILEAIVEAGHSVPLILTQPDRPSGRGLKLRASVVSELAAAKGLSVDKPATLRTDESQRALLECHPDILVVAAYGLILPKSVLAIPLRGCLNVHASLLPRWRGAAPIQRAIMAGDIETGVDIMVMEPGLDTGPVLLERRVPIQDSDTAGSLTERLAEEGAIAIVQALADLDALVPTPQRPEGITYATKIDKSEAVIDWRESASAIERRVRAFNPAPGAATRLSGETLKVWEAVILPAKDAAPGTLIGRHQGAPVIACGDGGLALTLVQPAGARRMTGTEFLKGRPVPPGTVFG